MRPRRDRGHPNGHGKAGERVAEFAWRAFRRMAAIITAIAAASLVSGCAAAASPAYPRPEGNINDFARVLSNDDKANLDALVDAVLKGTGVTFAVAIVEDHGDESIEMYAADLYEEWGIGEKGEDRGLLIVVSMEDHDLRAEVGYGLEGVINDARAGECLDKMIPYFRDDEYGKGLYAGLLHAAQYVAKDAGVALDVRPVTEDYRDVGSGSSPWSALTVGLLALFVGLPLLGVAAFAARGRRCPRCRARLSVTDRVVQGATYEAGGLAMKVLHCSKCGYHDERPYRTARLSRPFKGGGIPPLGGPFWGGGLGGGKSKGGGFSGPRGFGGGRSGGGGASRKW